MWLKVCQVICLKKEKNIVNKYLTFKHLSILRKSCISQPSTGLFSFDFYRKIKRERKKKISQVLIRVKRRINKKIHNCWKCGGREKNVGSVWPDFYILNSEKEGSHESEILQTEFWRVIYKLGHCFVCINVFIFVQS